MNNKIILSSLGMDLKRVSIGLQRNSVHMADRFSEEALKRIEEINMETVTPYIKHLLKKTKIILKQENKERLAEDALLYSTLLLNYAKHL